MSFLAEFSIERTSNVNPSPLRSISGISFTIGCFFKLQVSNLTDFNLLYQFGLSQVTYSNGYNGNANFLGIRVEAAKNGTDDHFRIMGTAPSSNATFTYGQFGTYSDVWEDVFADKWLMMAFYHDHTTQRRGVRLIDCTDGTILKTAENTASFVDPVTASDYDFIERRTANLSNGSILLAEDWMVSDVLDDAALQTIAQNAFVTNLYPSTALMDINYMLPPDILDNPHPTADSIRFIDSASGRPQFTKSGAYTVSTDNPVDVLKINSVTPDAYSIDVEGFSILTDLSKVVAFPFGSSPTAADVYNEVGSVTAAPIVFDGSSNVTVTLTGLSTNTDYDIYLVQSDGAGGYLLTEKVTQRTHSGISMTLKDRQGTLLADVPNIDYSVFLGTNANALGTKLGSGTASMVGNTISFGVGGSSPTTPVVVVLSKDGIKYGAYPATLV